MFRTLITVLIAAVAVLLCVNVWSAATQSLHAQTPDYQDAGAEAFALEIAEPVNSAKESAPFELLAGEKRVLSEYQELMRRKSERMSDEELQEEVERLRTELTEQDAAADQALAKLVHGLQQHIVEFRGTPAADKAAAALHAIQTAQRAKKADGPTPIFY